MSVLLPWDRKKPADKGHARESRPLRRTRSFVRPLVIGAILLVLTALLATRLVTPDLETLWEVAGGRLISASSGKYLVAVGQALRFMDGSGKATDLGNLPSAAILAGDVVYLAQGGRLVSVTAGGKKVELAVLAEMEQVVSVLDGGTVLTAKAGEGGKFGEQWTLVARSSSGAALWSIALPGLPSLVSQREDRLAVAVTDLSSGGIPSVASLDRGTGKVVWLRSLKGAAWRALGIIADGTTVAVLDSSIVAVKPAGAIAWSYTPQTEIEAAVVSGDATCVSAPANHRFSRFVYPYEVRVYGAGGALLWERGVRQRPLMLQDARGEALIALAENHVLGFHMRDGERLFAERTAGYPVSLTGDTLLVRDGKGLSLRKFRRPGGIS